MIEILAAQIGSLRAQVGSFQAQVVALEALITALQAEAEANREADDVNAAPVGCPHTNTENVGTFGLPIYRCEDCGKVVEG